MAHTRKTPQTVARHAAEVLAGGGTKMDLLAEQGRGDERLRHAVLAAGRPAGASALAQNDGKQSRLS